MWSAKRWETVAGAAVTTLGRHSHSPQPRQPRDAAPPRAAGPALSSRHDQDSRSDVMRRTCALSPALSV
jgi:hypothetical protein